MTVTDADKAHMIDRAVKGGRTRKDSEALLNDLLQRHSGDNLAYALHYNGFVAA